MSVRQTIRPVVGLLTAAVILLVAGGNVRPSSIRVPHSLLLIAFGICLAALVSVSDSHGRGAPCIRRSSRLVYLWLYVLVAVNALAAWWNGYPFEAAANKLGGFVVTGIVVFALFRISAVRLSSVARR
jgi:hypothetical protein